MNKSTPRLNHFFQFTFREHRIFGRMGKGMVLLSFALMVVSAQAGTAAWNGSVNTNWSNGGNWTGGTGTAGVPGAGDIVLFNNTGNATSAAGISNYVNSTGGNFLGTISALEYTNTAGSFQNTLIASGVTLNITNNTGPFSTALFAGTPTAAAANAAMFATISGPGATLNINNTNAVISVTQSGGNTSLATLAMTNLDTFVANINRIAIGDFRSGVGTVAAQGSLFLAKTNTITTSWAGVIANPYGGSAIMTNSIQLGVGSSATLGGINALFLGLTNGIFTDSIGVGGVKGGGSAAAPATIAFAPVFVGSNPTAYFRGMNGNSSRMTLWSVGDTGVGSGSSAPAFGKVDLSGGSVDVLVDMMILGRDRNGTAALDGGVFTFTAGNVNVNNLLVGDQGSASTGSAVSGNMNVNGAATLTVNVTLELGHTTLTGGVANALKTSGLLNILNGTVNASNVVVGAGSTTNIINMTNATLVVSNSLATNASGLFLLTMTNSILGLPVTADATRKVLAQTLTTAGTTNLVQLTSVPIFSSYPTQFTLIKYTTLNGAGYNFGLASIPAAAPGAQLINNSGNNSIDLSLPASPLPVITSQPTPFSGNVGDNETTNFTVVIAGTSVTPLTYQWYYTNAGSTVALANGPGPSGLSTLSGTATNALLVSNAQTNDNGGFFAVITNSFGAVTSSVAALNINSGGPPIVTGPFNQTVIQGNNANFSASVAANPPATTRWQRGGIDIPGATGTSITVTNVQFPADDQAQFSIIASNSFGVVTNSAILTVIVPPTISAQPTSLVVTNTQSASFTVTQIGGVPTPTYQWKKNTVPITLGQNPTAQSATLSFPSASPSDTATYAVVVQNAAGTVTSSNVTLTVNSTMAISSLIPANGAPGVCYDTPLTITFSQAPTLNNIGAINIFNATNPATPVDTINLPAGNPQSRVIGGVTLNAFVAIISSNTAVIYPHSGVMTSNQTYYVTIDDGAFKDSAGAYFAGITDSNTWQFTTKPAGPANATNLVVSADGSGDFCTVQGSLDFLPNGNTNHVLLNIRNGTYREIVRLNSKNNITLRGQDRHQTVISYANNDAMNGGTSGRPMFGVLGANDIAFENLTLTNGTPKGGSQAEALFLNVVKRCIVYNIDLDSFQDTLLVNATGDLAYFQGNHIQGDTDFVWGQGTAFLTNCEIMTLSSGSAANFQNITQPRTAAGTNGLSFVNCQLTRLTNTITFGGLGRSLGFADGNAAYINCLIDAHIAGWQDPQARYWEYGNSNLSGTLPTNYNGVQLTNGDPRQILAQSSTNWLYGWQPQLAPNILTQPVSLSVSGGQMASFTVVATGIPDASYQWLKNNVSINSETNATLTITNAYAGDAATYAVLVSNGAGSVTSGNATLAVANTAPTLNPVSDVVINAGATLNITNVASDPDVPTQTLTFSLLSAPTNATIGTSTGIFTWRPLVSQADTTNLVSVQVVDNGTPILSATQNFNVTVNPLVKPTLSSVSYGGGQFSLTVGSGTAGPDYIVQVSTDLVTWQAIFTNSSAVTPFSFTDTNAGASSRSFYRVRLAP